ncbi:MAG: TetR/AcrR family transcriptional regulator [Peptostreptococcaceae bacterium]|nr:TetR/AcrR family transcriptional regulator [Peptostreptococcaceae bacterium]
MSEKELATRDLILKAARYEFFQKGFREASLRSIADAAKVTTGSLYWHFKNKEELLDILVGPHYEHVMGIYKKFVQRASELSIPERLEGMRDNGLDCVCEMLEYMYMHIEEFKFLIADSDGTKYARFLDELIEYEIDDTHKFYEDLEQKQMVVEDGFREIEHIIVSGMFTSVFKMLVYGFPLEKAMSCAEQIVNFYTAGWLYVMDLPLPEAMKRNKKSY